MQFNLKKGFDSNFSIEYGILYFKYAFDCYLMKDKFIVPSDEEKMPFMIANVLRSF